VLATVGTDHHPFDRLVDWIDAWAERRADRARVVIQYGRSRRPSIAEGRAFLSPDELAELIGAAAAVVTHGGPGSIVDATAAGWVPIVVPRRPELGEHVDDHQVRFADRLVRAGAIRVPADRDEAWALLDAALEDRASLRRAPSETDGTVAAERFGALVDRLVRPRGAARGPRILFVAGWGRSGSTLLDRMLGQLPGVFSAGELRDVWQRGVLEDRRCGCGERFSACPVWTEIGRRAFGGWDAIDVLELQRLRRRLDRPWRSLDLAVAGRVPGVADDARRYVDALERLYLGIHEATGAEVIVDSSKIPTSAMLLRRIPGVDLRMVHLVRDPRGVVHSWQRRVARPDGAEGDEMLRYATFPAAVRYLLYNGLTHAIRVGLPYRFLRYEDLVREPAGVLRGVAAFAGLHDPPDLGFLGEGTVDLRPNHTVDGNPMRLTTGPIPLREDLAWRHELAPGRRRLVSTVTAPLLARYGYPLREER
jgi:UDP-N-acetylglucosamine transferase subunit ALG13